MIVKYDALDRLEKPQLILCNPGCTYQNGVLSNVVCPIIDHEAEEAVFNFNATSELNFRVNKPKHELELTGYYDQPLLRKNIITFSEDFEGGLMPQTIGLEIGKQYYFTVKVFGQEISILSDPVVDGSTIDPRIPSGTSALYYSFGGGISSLLVVDGVIVNYYFLTSDTTVVSGKTYYQFINNEYVVVTNPVSADIGSYYERLNELSVDYGNGAYYDFSNLIDEIIILDIKRESEEEFSTRVYDSLQNRRLVFFKDVGFFMINNVEDGYNGNNYYKDIKAQSIDVELQQKMLPYIPDGTYQFWSESNNEDGIIQIILRSIPLWTINHIDDTIKSKYRTFEDVSTEENCLSFLLNEVQDAYECIIVFDIVNRTVDVYDQNSYVRETNIYLTNNDLINTINVTENADDLYTAISVFGDNDITISGINPLGTNTIYDFTYYLDWMTSGLKQSVINWQNEVNSSFNSYYTNSAAYYNLLDDEYNSRAKIDRLNGLISIYEKCKDNIVGECNGATTITQRGQTRLAEYNAIIETKGGEQIRASTINELLTAVQTKIAEYESLLATEKTRHQQIETSMEDIKQVLDGINNSLKFENYFSDEELSELNYYIFQGSYTDNYIVFTDSMTNQEKFEQMKILYDRAKMQLDKISRPTQEFSLDVENFIFAKRFQHFSESIETGCLISVELRNNDIAMLFLTSMSINYDDKNFSLTFGNRFNKFDVKSLFESVLGSVSKSANTLSYVKDIIYPIKKGELDLMKEAIKSSRNLTMADALTSVGEETLIDATGYTGRKLISETGEYDPHQIKIISSNIIFTNDGWDTSKLAIGEINLGDGQTVYGVNGEAIIGEMLIGNNLQINSYTGNVLNEYVKTSDTEVSYEYINTADITVDPNKTYYQYIDNEYVEVEHPSDEDIRTYYEKVLKTYYIYDDTLDEYIEVVNPVSADIDTYYEKIGVLETKALLEVVNDRIISAVESSAQNIGTIIEQTAEDLSVKVKSLENENYMKVPPNTIIDPNTTYYQYVEDQTASGDRYVVVTNPVQSDIDTYYEKTRSTSVTTTTGYKFDENGLSISKSNSALSTTVTEDGLYVNRNDGGSYTTVLEANSEGVDALNLTSRQFLIIGKNSRFEDYGTNDERTACFYIG